MIIIYLYHPRIVYKHYIYTIHIDYGSNREDKRSSEQRQTPSSMVTSSLSTHGLGGCGKGANTVEFRVVAAAAAAVAVEEPINTKVSRKEMKTTKKTLSIYEMLRRPLYT